MNYKNQAINKDLFLAEIELMLTSVVVIIIAKEEIKNFKKEGVIYTILITSKYKILPKLGGLQSIYLIILSLA